MESKKVDPRVAACLRCGQFNGLVLEPIEQFEDGVKAKTTDGKVIFLTNEQLAVMGLRNRGRG